MSASRIDVTHVGSLPRPDSLIEANATRLEAGGDLEGFPDLLSESVVDVVARQKAVGITIPNDGEYGKAMSGKVDYGAWWSYSFQRVGGTELLPLDPDAAPPTHRSEPGHIVLTSFPDRRDWTEFADAYNDPSSGIHIARRGGFALPVATGPIAYTGQDQVASDIANLKAALAKNGYATGDGFITSVSPGSAARIGNAYYDSEEAFIYAWADVLREEYTAILDAGLTLQIDDPSIAENWDQIKPEPSVEDYLAFTKIRIDAINHAIRGLPQERIRLHICWGSWHGPHTTDIEFRHIVDLVLQANVGAYSFEGANARHEHEWKIWRDVTLPEGKKIIPGVVGHATNVVEHPELVADRIENFARLVGPENVIASTDCGLGGRIHPQIAWAKLEALSKGAEIATERLFGRGATTSVAD